MYVIKHFESHLKTKHFHSETHMSIEQGILIKHIIQNPDLIFFKEIQFLSNLLPTTIQKSKYVSLNRISN